MDKQARDAFKYAYFTAAMWTTDGEDNKPLAEDCKICDIDSETRGKMEADCDKFCDLLEGLSNFAKDNTPFLMAFMQPAHPTPAIYKQAGSDFWYARAGVAEGFNPAFWPEGVRNRLYEAAGLFGKFSLYAENGKVYGHAT